MLRGPENESLDAKERYLAFKAGAKKHGFALKDSSFYPCPRFEEEAGYQAMLSWIRTRDFPEAIFCANDDIARGAVRALKYEKLRVPEHVGIVGYDDSKVNEYMSPPLTSVRQPLEAMGRAAVEILNKLIRRQPKTPIQLKFEPELRIRGSA
jgi:DNA-binding LacI/PurR family transcriptional regulator